MIHVCFALYDKTGRYSKFTGTAMLSIFENTTSEVTVHILHDNTLPAENRDKFIYIAGRYGQTVKFYNVEILCADKIAELLQLIPSVKDSKYSVATFYRFLMPYVLPSGVDKCIYLDSDIIVNLDIVELWKIDLGDKVLGAIPEITNKDISFLNYSLCVENFVAREDYFNAGVLLINLNALNSEETTLKNAIRFVSENPRHSLYFDQDILNYCFSKRYLKLPTKFNRLMKWCRVQGENYIDKKIYHYIQHTSMESFGLDMRDPFNRMWMYYFIKTPFFDTDAIGRLYMSLEQFHVNLKQLMIQLSTSLLGKTRAFFVPPGSLDAIKKIFTIRNNEEIILAENQDSLKKLLNAMKKSRGKKVFFILMNGFPLGLLVQAGFVYGKDFVDGMQFLSEVHGVPMDSHQLIKAM